MTASAMAVRELSLGIEADLLTNLDLQAGRLCRLIRDGKARRAPEVFDLALGYFAGAELARGWWERERRVCPPLADGGNLMAESSYFGCEMRAIWLVRVAPPFALSCLVWDERVGDIQWLAEARIEPLCSVRGIALARLNMRVVRERIELETGYERLSTPADCLDASRVYPRRSVASRFLMALAGLAGAA